MMRPGKVGVWGVMMSGFGFVGGRVMGGGAAIS